MPDWFYRTVAQPVLFALPDRTARGLALGVIGALGRNRAGRAVIDFMGHMHADPRLATEVGGVRFSSPVGIGWRVDPEARATRGLQQFGAGCVEQREGCFRRVVRRGKGALRDGPAEFGRRSRGEAEGVCLTRRETETGEESLEFPSGEAYSVVPWDRAAGAVEGANNRGVVLQVGSHGERGGWIVPAAMPTRLPAQVRAWRERLGPHGVVVVSGGVAEPADAVSLVEAGASLVLVETGLVFGGPGMIKRCNEALAGRYGPGPAANASGATGAEGAVFRQSWFWTMALGVALAGGGLLALILSLGRVLLPYDEQFLGLSVEALRLSLPQLHAFMAHDRGTLAGVMLGLGWLYGVLGWRGTRCGVGSARTAVIASALAGFASFFSFLGFGYFDTLHAFVAAVLFQLTVQVMVGRSNDRAAVTVRPDNEDGAWRRSQWGQLCWIVHAVGLILAGTVILGIGMTHVFVAEDLAYLCMTVEQVQAMGERVVSVVAHDRATLGGMLWAAGVGMLLPVLWCHRRGEGWLWWGMAGLGLPAYVAAIGMHVRVGYLDPFHLVPAVAGLALWAGGLVLSGSYLRGGTISRE